MTEQTWVVAEKFGVMIAQYGVVVEKIREWLLKLCECCADLGKAEQSWERLRRFGNDCAGCRL